jgi:hypothetical protein
MANQAGDYGGSNAQANRQAALQRMPTGAAGSAALRPTAPKSRTGGRVSAGPTGKYSRSSAPPAPTPGPMNTDPNAWLGTDTQYQDALRQLQLASTNFGADITRRQGEVNTDYDTSNRAMGQQKVQDLDNMENDWAGRGLIRSGLYAGAVGDYNQEFDQRMAELVSARDRTLAQLIQEQQAFQTQQQLDQQAAREAALRRKSSGLETV